MTACMKLPASVVIPARSSGSGSTPFAIIEKPSAISCNVSGEASSNPRLSAISRRSGLQSSMCCLSISMSSSVRLNRLCSCAMCSSVRIAPFPISSIAFSRATPVPTQLSAAKPYPSMPFLSVSTPSFANRAAPSSPSYLSSSLFPWSVLLPNAPNNSSRCPVRSLYEPTTAAVAASPVSAVESPVAAVDTVSMVAAAVAALPPIPNIARKDLIVEKIPVIPLIALYPNNASLRVISDFAISSSASATSSGVTASIQFSTVTRKSLNSWLFRKSASASETRSMKRIKPSPTVSANGSRCSQNSARFARNDSQSTFSLNFVSTSSSSGSPFSIVHVPRGRSTFV